MSNADFQAIEKAVRERMMSRDLAPSVIDEFVRRVRLVHAGETGKTPWNEIGDLRDEDYAELEQLQQPADDAALRAKLGKLVVVKLNGGLGTSMGLTKVKSLIPVKDGDNFLQIIRKQILRLRERSGTAIPLLFMNSFNTQADTLADPGIAELNKSIGLPADFLQNMAPRLDRATLLPIGDGSDDSHWCPPGHGDIFLALQVTGILDQLIEKGYRVVFLSNGDNLGATVDPRLLDYFLSEDLEFMSEVTPKTAADLKGGVLFRRKGDGDQARIELLETAQVPEEHLPDFQNIERFAHFNINNLWVNLEALRDRLSRGGLELALIVNPKKYGAQDILQLETAMGAAIGQFDRSRVMIVPRSRFAPVKSCADLFVRRSDAYILNEETLSLEKNPGRTLGEPIVRLSDDYKKLADFERLVPRPPSIKDCESLEVNGPVIFDTAVHLKGKVGLSTDNTAGAPVSSAGKTEFQDESIRL